MHFFTKCYIQQVIHGSCVQSKTENRLNIGPVLSFLYLAGWVEHGFIKNFSCLEPYVVCCLPSLCTQRPSKSKAIEEKEFSFRL